MKKEGRISSLSSFLSLSGLSFFSARFACLHSHSQKYLIVFFCGFVRTDPPTHAISSSMYLPILLASISSYLSAYNSLVSARNGEQGPRLYETNVVALSSWSLCIVCSYLHPSFYAFHTLSSFCESNVISSFCYVFVTLSISSRITSLVTISSLANTKPMPMPMPMLFQII